MEALLQTSEGDMRKAITTLQSCARLKDGADEAEVTGRDVREMSGVVPDEWVGGMVDVCKKNSFEKMQAYVDEFMAEGYSVVQFIDQLHSRVVDDEALSDRQKSAVCEALAVNEFRLLDGASEYLQLIDLCAVLVKTLTQGA